MNKLLKKKIKESFESVLPITIIVLILSIILVPISIDTMLMFIVGAVLLVVGMGFFTLGTDMAMIPMGEGIGVYLTKFKKSTWIAIIVFVMGVFVTVAEPDLQVLAKQVPAIPDSILIWTVAVGVGIFLVIAIFRVLLKFPLSKLLLLFYGVILIISFFTPNNFIAVAFDSGGVTTGPITVPFIMALGLGLSAVRSDKDSQGDSFGFVALCSIGPILSVLLLGIIYNPSNATYEKVDVVTIETTRDVFVQFAKDLPVYLEEVLIALALTFFVPKMFTGIAFDSGGVCSGPMTSTFLLPFAMGACEAAGGNVLTDAFGIVAMVAMTPLITVQIMGMVYQRKMKALEAEQDIELLELAQEDL
ncbi:MAG: DUF1538 domain-containing protein [Coprobacillaceae bacterium]